MVASDSGEHITSPVDRLRDVAARADTWTALGAVVDTALKQLQNTYDENQMLRQQNQRLGQDNQRLAEEVKDVQAQLDVIARARRAEEMMVGRKDEVIAVLEKQRDVDTVTFTNNRLSFDRDFPKIIARAAVKQQTAALVFIDLDNFHSVNKAYLHTGGDYMLREAAGVMKEMIRPGDMVYRYGGDEFVIIMSDVTAEDGENIDDILTRRRFAIEQAITTALADAKKELDLQPDVEEPYVGATAAIGHIREGETATDFLERVDAENAQRKNTKKEILSQQGINYGRA